MNISRQQLDEALRRVQQGLMQPNEAARWLLDQSAASATTVAELMNRLGPPPEAIERDWDEQLAELATAYQLTHGQRLPALTAHDILIDSDNRLTLSSRIQAAKSSRSSSTNESATSERSRTIESIQQQHGSILTPTFVLEAPQIGKLFKAANRQPQDQSVDKKQPRLTARHRWIAPAASLSLAIIVLGIMFYRFAWNGTEDIALRAVASDSKRPAQGNSSIFSPTAIDDPATSELSFAEQSESANTPLPSTDEPMKTEPAALTADSVASTGQLIPEANAYGSQKSAQSMAETAKQEESPSSSVPKQSKATLGLDSFAGSKWVTANELLPTADFDTTKIESDTSVPMADASTAVTPSSVDKEASMIESAQPEAAAIDSPTKQTIGRTSIELPALPSRNATEESIQTISIVDQPVDNLELLFPIDTSIVLIKGDRSWTIQDKKDQSPLAKLTTQDGGLQFQWTTNAASRPGAKQLSLGLLSSSLRDGTKRPIFLRPMMTADAWPIDFSTSDAKAAWLIGTAPPLAASRLTVELLMPKEVIQTWVQTPDPAHVTRHQSIAEFALESDPTITIRSQLNIRTGNRITLRMRHAVQLDPSQGWQSISSDKIQSALQQVTDQLARAVAQQTEIKATYSKASPAQKRVLSPQTNAISEAVVQLQTLHQRLTKYEQLLSQLQHTSHLIIRLEVAWPESAPQPIQPIFELVAPVASDS